LIDVHRYLERHGRRIERALQRYLPAHPSHPSRLIEAMRYSLFGGGKRLRPTLVLAATEAVGGSVPAALPFACATEMIHTYSLIHDDLPAMDDDAVRRGRPTNHVVFGDALAILAGDGLLTEAFRIMAEAIGNVGQRRAAILAMAELASASGAHGMVGGQAHDLAAEGTTPDLPTVELIHVRKTGALILAAVRSGALVGGGRAAQLRALTRYGEFFGLAFQVVDDILDVEGGLSVTGKVQGKDQARHKVTFPSVLGVPAAKERAQDLYQNAIAALAGFSRSADPLRAIARFVVERAVSVR
jgi:geranylgeranyl diphosphate synthase, type II